MWMGMFVRGEGEIVSCWVCGAVILDRNLGKSYLETRSFFFLVLLLYLMVFYY